MNLIGSQKSFEYLNPTVKYNILYVVAFQNIFLIFMVWAKL